MKILTEQRSGKINRHFYLIMIVLLSAVLTSCAATHQEPVITKSQTALSNLPTYTITPLFHSASITLFNQTKTSEAQVQYKSTRENTWHHALPLYWEPIRKALSGSIVHLQTDTEYQLKVTLFQQGSLLDTQEYAFKTRSASPPIDPDLVYQLADIYQGGQLDLEALNIQGSEQGWAKIIGDNHTVIVAADHHDQAIKIGDNSYIYFENITVKGGRLNGITSRNAHHLWFNGCDISGWGRHANVIKHGLAYESENSQQAINYDAGFRLERSGVIVVENCTVHSPNSGANSWQYGHPRGPTAFLTLANHPDERFQGQIVIRNNRFYGSPLKRFNDVIESRSNGRVWGGFIRDSAIYNNYLAFANDDIIELDGGQSNVLFYNNHIEQGFCGVSAIPNMLGPSYIFNNYIHNMGDERQQSWCSIKLGGLVSAPAGIVNVFENLITSSNGLAVAGFKGDGTFWTHAQNNIIVHNKYGKYMGYAIHDPAKYPDSTFINNYMFNTQANIPVYNANLTSEFEDVELLTQDTAENMRNSRDFYSLEISPKNILPNFSQLNSQGQVIIGITGVN